MLHLDAFAAGLQSAPLDPPPDPYAQRLQFTTDLPGLPESHLRQLILDCRLTFIREHENLQDSEPDSPNSIPPPLHHSTTPSPPSLLAWGQRYLPDHLTKPPSLNFLDTQLSDGAYLSRDTQPQPEAQQRFPAQRLLRPKPQKSRLVEKLPGNSPLFGRTGVSAKSGFAIREIGRRRARPVEATIGG